MTFLKCRTPRCGRQIDLALCEVCRDLVCPLHGSHVAGEFICHECVPATPAPNRLAGQGELFA